MCSGFSCLENEAPQLNRCDEEEEQGLSSELLTSSPRLTLSTLRRKFLSADWIVLVVVHPPRPLVRAGT